MPGPAPALALSQPAPGGLPTALPTRQVSAGGFATRLHHLLRDDPASGQPVSRPPGAPPPDAPAVSGRARDKVPAPVSATAVPVRGGVRPGSNEGPDRPANDDVASTGKPRQEAACSAAVPSDVAERLPAASPPPAPLVAQDTPEPPQPGTTGGSSPGEPPAKSGASVAMTPDGVIPDEMVLDGMTSSEASTEQPTAGGSAPELAAADTPQGTSDSTGPPGNGVMRPSSPGSRPTRKDVRPEEATGSAPPASMPAGQAAVSAVAPDPPPFPGPTGSAANATASTASTASIASRWDAANRPGKRRSDCAQAGGARRHARRGTPVAARAHRTARRRRGGPPDIARLPARANAVIAAAPSRPGRSVAAERRCRAFRRIPSRAEECRRDCGRISDAAGQLPCRTGCPGADGGRARTRWRPAHDIATTAGNPGRCGSADRSPVRGARASRHHGREGRHAQSAAA